MSQQTNTNTLLVVTSTITHTPILEAEKKAMMALLAKVMVVEEIAENFNPQIVV